MFLVATVQYFPQNHWFRNIRHISTMVMNLLNKNVIFLGWYKKSIRKQNWIQWTKNITHRFKKSSFMSFNQPTKHWNVHIGSRINVAQEITKILKIWILKVKTNQSVFWTINFSNCGSANQTRKNRNYCSITSSPWWTNEPKGHTIGRYLVSHWRSFPRKTLT